MMMMILIINLIFEGIIISVDWSIKSYCKWNKNIIKKWYLSSFENTNLCSMKSNLYLIYTIFFMCIVKLMNN